MDTSNISIWLAITSVIIAIVTKVVRGRIYYDPVCNKPLPPLVTSSSMILLVHKFITKGFLEMIHDLYTKLGSVFTISILGTKVTFLIGPEVSSHFYQGSESEMGHGKFVEFLVPMLGNEVLYAVDETSRHEQIRFFSEWLKPSKLRCHVCPIIQEVEDYFAQWGQEGTVDLKHELEHVLMLITARCMLGKEVREKMLCEVSNLYKHLIDDGMNLTTMLFPYAPTPANRRRDKARARLSDIFAEILRSRRTSSNGIKQDDVLQNLINARYQDGRPTTDGEVTGLVLAILLAAEHPSSAISAWIGARLLSEPVWLAAAVEEQGQIIKRRGENIDYNVLQEMDVLYRCIKETLRMHPPAPMFFRKVQKNFTVRTKEGNVYEIPSGHVVASPVLVNNTIPYIYKDPSVYDPGRFAAGIEEDRVSGKFSFTAFGGGRHACLGENYAYMQIKIVWSHLLRNFKLELMSPCPKTNWKKLIVEPQGKVMVSYKRRTLSVTTE